MLAVIGFQMLDTVTIKYNLIHYSTSDGEWTALANGVYIAWMITFYLFQFALFFGVIDKKLISSKSIFLERFTIFAMAAILCSLLIIVIMFKSEFSTALVYSLFMPHLIFYLSTDSVLRYFKTHYNQNKN